MPFDSNHSLEEWNCEGGNNPENESESEKEISSISIFALVRDRQYNCFFKLFIRVCVCACVCWFFLCSTGSSSSSFLMCQSDAAVPS